MRHKNFKATTATIVRITENSEMVLKVQITIFSVRLGMKSDPWHEVYPFVTFDWMDDK